MSFGNIAKDYAITSLAAQRSAASKSTNGYFAGDIRQNGNLVQYQRSPGVWITAEFETVPSSQLGNPYTLPDYINDIALSFEGRVIAVGLATADPSPEPFLTIMTNTAGFYSQQSFLRPSDSVGITEGNVSLNAAGSVCAFGSQSDNGDIGAVWIYAYLGGVWSLQGTKITGPGEIGPGKFGQSLSLSGDGKLLAVGAPFDGTAGAAYIFDLSSLTSPVFVARLVGTPLDAGAVFGWDVDFSQDGSTLAVGASSNLSLTGSVFIYTNVQGVWVQQTLLVPPPDTGSFMGYGVSLSEKGNILAASALNSGVVFYRSGESWSSGTKPPLPFDIVGNLNNNGYLSLSSSEEKSTLMNTNDSNNGNVGASWIYTEGPTGTWTQNGPALAKTGSAPGQLQWGMLSRNGKVGATVSVQNPGLLWVFV